MSKIRNVFNDKDFFDGALACDDDQIQAHNLINSACMHYLLINCILYGLWTKIAMFSLGIFRFYFFSLS